MKQFGIAAGLIVLMSSAALAQSTQTQGHAGGPADFTIDAKRTSQRSATNPGVTTGINHKASGGWGTEGERWHGSSSAPLDTTTGPDAGSSLNKVPPR